MTYIPKSPSEYQGNQVLLNSDRLIFNAKSDSILLFANETIGFSANGSFHFDTGPEKDTSKFVVNSPNIYLGLEFDNTLPTEPAVLGNELQEILEDIIDCIGGVIFDIQYKVSYVVSPPGGVTGVNPANESMLRIRKNQLQSIKDSLENMKSTNTKLV